MVTLTPLVLIALLFCAGCSTSSPLAPSTSTPSHGFGLQIPADYVERQPPEWVNRYAGSFAGAVTVHACQDDGGFAGWCADYPRGQRLRWRVSASQSGAEVIARMELGTNVSGAVAGRMNAQNWLPLSGVLAFDGSTAIATLDPPSDLIRHPSSLLSELWVRVTQPGLTGSGRLHLTGSAGE